MDAETNTEQLVAADAARRRATIDRDLDALDAYLADNLVYVHGNGRRDDKGGLLALYASEVFYSRMDLDGVEATVVGELGFMRGNVTFQMTTSTRSRHSHFLSVWQHSAVGWQLVSWQSTHELADATSH